MYLFSVSFMMVDALEENVMKDILNMGLKQRKTHLSFSRPHCWQCSRKSPQMIRAKDKVQQHLVISHLAQHVSNTNISESSEINQKHCDCYSYTAKANYCFPQKHKITGSNPLCALLPCQTNKVGVLSFTQWIYHYGQTTSLPLRLLQQAVYEMRPDTLKHQVTPVFGVQDLNPLCVTVGTLRTSLDPQMWEKVFIFVYHWKSIFREELHACKHEHTHSYLK